MIAPVEASQEVGVQPDQVNIEDDPAGDADVEQLKVAPDPGQPTWEEIEEHRLTHQPYRSWCKWCVMGRGVCFLHRNLKSKSAIPRIGIDYFYITQGGIRKRNELEHAQDPVGEATLEDERQKGIIVKCIVIRDWESKNIYAHCVPCKGADEDEYVAQLVADDVAWLGYTRLIIKSDNEPALLALVRQVLGKVMATPEAVEQATKESSPEYDSQANGGTEIGIKLVRGIFRTIKLCLEARIGKFIPITHSLIPWMLEHSCMLLNVRVKGQDGLTPWTRIRGRPFSQRLIGFGEVVLYRLPTKGPQHNPDGNMGTQWREGIFLGYDRGNHTYIVGTTFGAAWSRAMTRRPYNNRWSAEKLASLRATPWSERRIADVRVESRFDQPAETAQDPRPPERPGLPRQLRIDRTDLDKYGYTSGCVQCDHVRRYGKTKPGTMHTDRCRARILNELSQSPEGQDRLRRQEDRVTRALAEHVERGDQEARTQGEQAPNTVERPVSGERPERPVSGERRIDNDGPAENLGGPSVFHDDIQADSTVHRGQDVSDARPTRPISSPSTPQPRPLSAPVVGDPSHATTSNAQEDTMDESAEAQQPDAEDMDMGFIGNLEPEPFDVASSLLLQQLGGLGRKYRREARRGFKALVSEIYSPPRVVKELKAGAYKCVLPGFSLDISGVDEDDGMPWDFTIAAKREKVREMLRQRRPYLLIGSPPCTAYSTWQALNAAKSDDPTAYRKAKLQGDIHLRFVASLYRDQLENGKYFLHEHPRWASSWGVPEVNDMVHTPGVRLVHGDQCQFGAEVKRGKLQGSPVLKPIGFLTNSTAIANALEQRCQGRNGACSRAKGGKHAQCQGTIATDAAIYPRGLCKTILKATAEQLKLDGHIRAGCFGIQPLDDDAEIEAEIHGPAQGFSGRYKDDLSGQVLNDKMVMAARMKELEWFHAKGVWIKVPRSEARATTGRPPITVRWVDVNKGDDACPNYRSRLVARQMKALDHSGTSYFAPAPPIEALRTVISFAMTRMGNHQPVWDPLSPQRTQISFVDVSRAYFNAKVDAKAPPMFVDLPQEDNDHHDKCGKLAFHMYGTRPAADGWQQEYSTMLIKLGFRQGMACPNVFRHPDRKIVTSVHGDDFTSSGPADALDWLEKAIAESYDITIGPRLGPGPNDAKEARALNRIVRWVDDRIEYEADPRQVERLVQECGMVGCKPMATPGVRVGFQELEGDEPLEQRLHTAFRSAAARGNYLSADRIDAQFGCKEICRWMSSPTQMSWKALKRLARFFAGAPRLVYVYRQQDVSHIDVYTDTDWAGCPKTRKSTSGGCVLLGRHAVKHWSSTQSSVALSSGEAEFNGVIRGAGQGLGYQALLADLGVKVPLRVWTDSSAAMGICSRQGLGKLRHLDTHTLWIQQAVRSKRVDLRKVLGTENPADLLTKHSLTREKLDFLVKLFGCEYIGGRAESAPLLRQGVTGKTTVAEADDNSNNRNHNDHDHNNITHNGRNPSVYNTNDEGINTTTVAGVGADNINAGDGTEASRDGLEDCGSPWMPHLELNATDLDLKFPPLEVSDDNEYEDLIKDDDDHLLNHGMALAQRIADEMMVSGRTRDDPLSKLV